MKKIIVMNDGETWGGIDGAAICIISDEDHDKLCEGSVRLRDLYPVVEISFKDCSPDSEEAT